MGKLNRLASACMNNIISGLSGTTSTINVPIKQLEQTILETRLAIIHKYALQNLLETSDLYTDINCLNTDCKSLDNCCDGIDEDSYIHTEIPQLAMVAGEDRVVKFIGSPDKSIKFDVYFDQSFKYRKYKKYKNNRPYVYINLSPNKHNMLDVYIFDAPMLERLSITAIFKSFDQIEQFDCCSEMGDDNYAEKDNFSDLDLEVIEQVTSSYIKYYRQLINPYPLIVTNNPGGTVPGMQQQQ